MIPLLIVSRRDRVVHPDPVHPPPRRLCGGGLRHVRRHEHPAGRPTVVEQPTAAHGRGRHVRHHQRPARPPARAVGAASARRGGALLGCSGGSPSPWWPWPDARAAVGAVGPARRAAGERRPRAAAAGPWPSPCSTPDCSTRPGPTAWRRDRPRQPVRRPDRHRPAGAIRPAVAASWSSDPACRWEFRLRPDADARWSDGSLVRAADFTRSAKPGRPEGVRRRRPGGPDPAVGGHRLPGVHRRPVPDDRRLGVSRPPPWSSA